MKVILQKDVSNLGDAGDIKEVADGYARNYLIPNNLVLVANESSQKVIAHQQKLIKLKKEKKRKENEKLIENMSGLEVVIKAKIGEEGKLFGSVTAIDIAKALKEKGYDVDKRKIQLDEHIREECEKTVSLKLDRGLSVDIKVTVEKE